MARTAEIETTTPLGSYQGVDSQCDIHPGGGQRCPVIAVGLAGDGSRTPQRSLDYSNPSTTRWATPTGRSKHRRLGPATRASRSAGGP